MPMLYGDKHPAEVSKLRALAQANEDERDEINDIASAVSFGDYYMLDDLLFDLFNSPVFCAVRLLMPVEATDFIVGTDCK